MQRLGLNALVLLAATLAAPNLHAQAPVPLAQQVETLLAQPAVSRAHWGIAVVDLDGTPIFAHNEAQLFQPASNAKLFTTATALALLGPDTTYTTKVYGRGTFSDPTHLKGDIVLVGSGDANLSARAIPYLSPKDRPKRTPGDPAPAPLRFLEALAADIAATGLKQVDGDVIGDDTLFPWDPYPADWSIDDMVWGYGAPVSALTVNDNQIEIAVRPAITAGVLPTITLNPATPAFYTLDTADLTTTAPKTGSHVEISRQAGSKTLRIYGHIAIDAPPDLEEVAIQDPAEYAAAALKSMLEAHGIAITGTARAAHRLPTDPTGFLKASDVPAEDLSRSLKNHLGPTNTLGSIACSMEDQGRLLAQHRSFPLADDLVVTNKVSQNLHAELLLEQLSRRTTCSPSRPEGAKVVRAMLLEDVHIDPDDFVFYDGSGLSGHDLVTPRATARLLVYAAAQPWFPTFKRSLPIGGEDGTLAARFPAPPLKDNLFAKTGTLSEARALSGYVVCASGRTVVFSVMVGNHTPRTTADRDTMDRIVAAIAAAN